jgi:predicted phage tail component-like protein
MYYIKYNEIDLTDIVKVRSVEIPSLPSITHSSFDVFERRGNIFNGVSYNERTITLKLIIQPNNPDDYDMYVNDVKRAFYVQEEQRLFCGDETLYMWCVPEGEINIIEIGNACAEAEIDLVAYEPYWYSTDYRTVNNNNLKVFNVHNDSDAEIFPIIKVGFSQSTTFFQMDNQSVGERFLLGRYPESGKQIAERSPEIFTDIMENTSGWTSWSSIDGNRSTGAKIRVTEEGWGLTCTNFGNSTDDTWHGACYKKSLKQPIKDFRCGFTISHNSTGINGDPTKIEFPFTDDEEVTTTTEPEYYYKVATSSGVDLRSGKDSVDSEGKVTQSPKIVTVPYGSEVTINDDENGWVNVTWESPNGYDGIGRHYSGWCKANNLKKYVRNKIVTEMRKNFITNKSTAIRTTPSRYSVNKLTIPTFTCVRVLYSKKFPTDQNHDEYEDFYELAVPYNGQTGYVLVEDLDEASDKAVEYEFEGETADDKTGAVEIYGYSANNVQLFRLGMYDDNEYYEHNYPVIRKNNEEFLSDKKFAPAPKTKTEYGNSGATVSNILSGQYGNWNNYYGEFHIERVDNKWSAFVTKIENGQVVKKISTNTVYDSKNENELLSYLVIYFGTMGSTEKASGMSISHCEVWTSWKELLEEGDDRTEDMFSFQEFKAGDILTIDNNVPSVSLNGIEHNELIDIGSSFFELAPGNNTMKIASDDPNVNIDVIWKPKHL